MAVHNLFHLLAQNPYPGRGIVLGREETTGCAVAAYFIMGRSENSRNRIFAEKDGGLVTQAANPAKMKDPSLVIYTPVRKAGRRTIVTNGDQTDTIYSCLMGGVSFEDALRTRTYEPDAPNFTPRISGLLTQDWEGFGYQLSILKAMAGTGAVQRFFFDYPAPQAGRGHFIHTYKGDGTPLPSFEGEPVCVALRGTIDAFGQALWQALHAENKVALFVRYMQPGGSEETRLYNRFQKV